MQIYALTVGGVYRKAELPNLTKHCATFYFSHPLVKEKTESQTVYTLFKCIHDGVFIKQHQ